MSVIGINHGTHIELILDDSRLCGNCGHNHWIYSSTPDGPIHCRRIGCECTNFTPHPDRRVISAGEGYIQLNPVAPGL